MSEVISFRLDKKNPREAQAYLILNTWIEKGFSTRSVLTTALLRLDQPGSDLEPGPGNRNWDAILDQISQLLDLVEKMKKPVVSQENNSEPCILRDSFLASIRHGAKPGIKLE